MTRCKQKECKFAAWRAGLCYRHFRESQGFLFDAVLKRFIKAK